MKAVAKKWIIRFLIVELITNIAFFTITPYLFGSIKPFNPQAKKVVTRVGVLQESRPSVYMEGSYKLKSGSKVTLISTQKDLDKYVGKKVSVKGALSKTTEGLVKIIDGPTVDKRLDVISLKSISTK